MTSNDAAPGEPAGAPLSDLPFEAVPAPLRAALLARGFTALTPVQQAVLDAGGGRCDLRISSETGSGKTVAIGLALAERLIEDLGADPRRRKPHSLVIAPTRELAAQVRDELAWLFAEVEGVTVGCVTGGTSIAAERARLRRPPAVLVGTPGRLVDHLGSGALDASHVVQLVLDEADRMLDMGFRDDLDAILAALAPDRRTHMVSATFSREVLRLVARCQTEPRTVEGTRLGTANDAIEHVACVVAPHDRQAALVNLLLMTAGERSLVFVRTRQAATDIAEQLAEDGFSALAISGELAQAQRTRALEAFRRGTLNTLVATDVAARGLDVPDVAQVVHFDPPLDPDVLVHRSGRTGRAGRKGRSVVLVAPKARRHVQRLFEAAGVDATWRDVPPPELVRERLASAARARLEAMLADAEAPNEAQLAEARRLVGNRDPLAVVALLARLAAPEAPCAPREVGAPSLGSARGPRERSTGRPQRARSSYTRFAITWGARDGATPRRVLAHVCRRGGIRGTHVGAIAVSAHSSEFEVEGEVAHVFSERVRVPDAREPHLEIRAL